MKNVESVPIAEFAKAVCNHKRVAKVLRDYNLDPERITPLIRDYFLEMGIYYVKPHGFFQLMVDEVLTFIRSSVDVKKIIFEMREREERLKNQRRVEKLSA